MNATEKRETQAGFTPGPWHVGNKGADSVFTEDSSRLCQVMPRYGDPYRSSREDFANARLIAAAPAVYAALKAIVDSSLLTSAIATAEAVDERDWFVAVNDAARAALAKVENQ